MRLLRIWPLVFTLATLVILLVGLLLPSPALAWFYDRGHLLGRILSDLETTPFRFDRIFHVLIFAWLVPCLAWLWPQLRAWRIVVLLLALAAVGELIQIPVPGRSANLEDWAFDVVGIGLGLPILWCKRHWMATSLRSSP